MKVIEGVILYGCKIWLETDDDAYCMMAKQLFRDMINNQQDPGRIRAEALGRVEMIKRNECNQDKPEATQVATG